MARMSEELMTDQQAVKVLYIAGWGRSGTTILDNIFGQLKGFFSVGEIRSIWERNFLENRSCGCRKLFSECEIWQDVVQRAFGKISQSDAEAYHRMADRYTSTRQIPAFLAGRGKFPDSQDFSGYLAVLEKLYRSIAQTTDSQVIVDSSKYPLYAAALSQIPGFEVYIVHMVRDPRAVAYSWMNVKKVEDASTRDQISYISPLKSSILWDSWNLCIEYLGHLQASKYYLLKYENFVDKPQASVENILSTFGLTQSVLPFVDQNTVSLQPNHTLSGNLDRFKSGNIVVKPDLRWSMNMLPINKLFVTALTWPVMLRYGYGV